MLIVKTSIVIPVALVDWHLVLGVWSFITSGAFWGKTIAWRRCVCNGCGSQFAYTILPRSKLVRYSVFGLYGTLGYQERRLLNLDIFICRCSLWLPLS